jgi:hypothetical protein
MGETQWLAGHVESMEGGIEDRECSTSLSALLANVNPAFNWVRLAQRIRCASNWTIRPPISALPSTARRRCWWAAVMVGGKARWLEDSRRRLRLFVFRQNRSHSFAPEALDKSVDEDPYLARDVGARRSHNINGVFRSGIVEQERLKAAGRDGIRHHERWCFSDAKACDGPLQYGVATVRSKAPFGPEGN